MIGLFDLIEDEKPRPRVCVYAGYTFGLIKHARECGFQQYLSGVVITPRYADRVLGDLRLDGCDAPWLEPDESNPLSDPLFDQEEAPSLSARIMLDNGAYPAYRRGEELTLSQQLDGIHAALDAIPTLEWIVAPDVVADARQTWARICACTLELETYGLDRLLLPVQDGMDIEAVAKRALELQCGVFVGGSGWKFKNRALLELAPFDLRWIHVGQANSLGQLEAAARGGADAVDSSSFLRAQYHNVAKRPAYRRALEEWAFERGSPVSEPHIPRPSRWRKPTLAECLSHRRVAARMEVA
jgi:hypothetical protein